LRRARFRRPWWRGALLYQIYPRSFADSNDDGIGDLSGIRARLDYLQWLGVDGIWLNPTFPSPNKDWGYDVADYCGVHPDLGTLADLDELIAAAAERDIQVVLDLVPAHTREDLVTGDYEPIEVTPPVWSWRRGNETAIALNLSDAAQQLPLGGDVLLSTKGRDDASRLEPWEGVVLALS
jgi:hypothetical protein